VFLSPVDQFVIVPEIIGQQVTPVSLTVADLDGTGNLDVAVAVVLLNDINQPGFFSIVINTGVDVQMQPIFANSVNIDTLDSNTRAIVSGDFDNDLDIDLAVANALGASINSVSAILNDGTGSFSAANRTKLSGPATTVGRLIVGDVNADTFLDLITVNQSHSYSVVLNDGGTAIAKAGQFSDQGQSPLGSQAVTPLDIPTDGGLGDIDGDGDLDLVCGLVGSSGGTGSLVVLPNGGNGVFGIEQPFAVGRDHTFLYVGDLDSDSDPDVVSMDLGLGMATVLLNRRLPVIDVALRAVINPTLTEEGALPAGLTQVCPGSGFTVEVWVSQIDGGTAGIAGGSVDLLFNTATVSATSIDHGSVFNNPSNSDVITAGLVDNMGGATALAGKAVGPAWALLARLPVTVTGNGPFTFTLAHGAFAFALAGGMPPLAVEAVDVSATLTLNVAVVDDGIVCTDDVCDTMTGVVVNAPNDVNCDDGQFCNGTETCSATLDCQAGTNPNCADTIGCTDDSCDFTANANTGACLHAPNDVNCDDGQFCNGAETCSATLDCQAGTAPTLSDGVACTDDTCDEFNNIVVNTPNNVNCFDADVCTTDVCNAVLGCVNSVSIYDLNVSGLAVDFVDFSLFAPHFSSLAGEIAYSECADFYFDGVIDASDVSFFGTAIGKPCGDVSIVLPDATHTPPLGCPSGPLRTPSVGDGQGASSLEIRVAILRSPSQFNTSDIFPVSHTNLITAQSVLFAEVWVRMSSDNSAGLTGGSVSLHVNPKFASPLRVNVDDGFPWFQGGEVDASIGSVINLSGGTLEAGVAAGTWVRFASAEFMVHRSGLWDVELTLGPLAFAEYATGAIEPAVITFTGAQVNVREVAKPKKRLYR